MIGMARGCGIMPFVRVAGTSPSGRAGRWGLEALGDYLRSGNEDVRLVLQAESVGALAAIEEIGVVPGVDAVFIGPTDLVVSRGLNEPRSELADLLDAAECRCAARGITVGTTATDDARELLEHRGYNFLVLGADAAMLRQGGAALVRAARTTAPGVER